MRELVSAGPLPLPVSGGGHARCRIPPASAPPVSKTALSAPGTSSPRPPVCKTALSAPGTCPPRLPVCKTALSAPGTSSPQPPVCKKPLPAPGTCSPGLPVCKSAFLAPGTCQLRDRKRRKLSGGVSEGCCRDGKRRKLSRLGVGEAISENRRDVGGCSEGWRGRKQAPNLHSSVFFSGNNCYICQN